MEARRYWNPYVAGVLMGLTLLATFLVVGNGWAPARCRSGRSPSRLTKWRQPGRRPTRRSAATWRTGQNPLKNWLVIEVIGVVIGGFLGAMSAGRFQVKVEKGPNISTRGRLRYALGGGIVMGFAAGLARGCTSGQALSGGAMLATGSWAFMMMVFAGGYAFAYLVRRQWI